MPVRTHPGRPWVAPQPPHPPSGSGPGLPAAPHRPTGLDACRHEGAGAIPPGPPISVALCGPRARAGRDCSPVVHRLRPPRGLGLGPPDPAPIAVVQEPLGFRRAGFAPASLATHAGIRTSARSGGPPGPPSPRDGTLPYRPRTQAAGGRRLAPLLAACGLLPSGPRGFGRGLSPVAFSAPAHSTSELLRTLSRMAASKPTSWLSVRPDLLRHSSPQLGTLAGGLGCFPLDAEASPPASHARRPRWRPSRFGWTR